MTKLPALLFVSSVALGCSHAAPPPPPPPPRQPVAEPTPAPAPTATPAAAPVAAPAQMIERPPAEPFRDPEVCKRPTRAYPRWCGDVLRERVKAKEEASKGDPQ